MDRPILFSGPMVRAILDGRKTQTRRVMNPQPESRIIDSVTHWWVGFMGWRPMAEELTEPMLKQHEIRYAVGDRLWVRESFAPSADGVGYMADHEGDPSGLGWKPSIHMPRAASRLTLVVIEVRIERLQDISEEDAKAEGVDLDRGDGRLHPTCRLAFTDLWDSLNAKRGFGWDANPWVVATSFDPHPCNIDDMEGAAA